MHIATKIIGKPSRVFNFFSYWLPPVLLTAGIFLMAGDLGSTATFTLPIQILTYLLPSYSAKQITQLYYLIRKLGHFTAYAVLFSVYVRAWYGHLGLSRGKAIVLALAVCFIVSLADEARQTMFASRTGSLWDVALDMSGALTAAIISFPLLRQPKRQKAQEEEGLTL